MIRKKIARNDLKPESLPAARGGEEEGVFQGLKMNPNVRGNVAI